MSSHRAERRRACQGKARHADQTAAVAALIAMRHDGIGNSHHTYKCAFCGGWHVGRPPARIRQAMRAKAAR